jgi:hypothetical protein
MPEKHNDWFESPISPLHKPKKQEITPEDFLKNERKKGIRKFVGWMLVLLAVIFIMTAGITGMICLFDVAINAFMG